MTLNEEILKEDPREANLPKWVRLQLGRARGEARRQAQLAENALLDTAPEQSDAIMHFYGSQIPVGLGGAYTTVRFLFEKGNYHRNYVDVRLCRDKYSEYLSVSGSNTLVISPHASNLIYIDKPRY